MSSEQTEPVNPKKARLARIQDHPTKRESIGNFSQTYSIRGRALSDEDGSQPMSLGESDSVSKSYSFQFEKDDKDLDPVKGKDEDAIDKTLYAKLTDSVQAHLDTVEDHLERLKAGTLSLADYTAYLNSIVIRQSVPVLEFDDIDALRNYNLPVVRFSPGNRPVATAAGNRLVFNNQISLVTIEVCMSEAVSSDEEGAAVTSGVTHVIRNLIKARRDDIFTFVSAAQTPYNFCVLTATAADNSIQFLDTRSSEVIFRVALENGQDLRTVVSAAAYKDLLVVGFDDFGIQVYSIQHGKKLKEFVLDQSGQQADVIQSIHALDDQTFRVASHQAIFEVTLEPDTFQLKRFPLQNTSTQQSEPIPESQELYSIVTFPTPSLYVYGGLGRNSISLLAGDNSSSISPVFQLALESSQKLVDLTLVNPDKQEFAVLVETAIERPKAASVHAPLSTQKTILLAKVEQDKIVILDSLPTFEEAVSILALSSGKHVVVEGNQTFAVFCIDDKLLHAQIVEGLLNAAVSGSADTRQISTEDSNNSSARGSAVRLQAARGLALKLDQPTAEIPSPVSGYQGLSSEELSKLIQDKVSQMKENLKSEIMEEIKVSLKTYIEEQVKASVAVELEKIRSGSTA